MKSILAFIGGVSLFFLLVFFAGMESAGWKTPSEYQSELESNRLNQLSYNLQHPTIVGTNEVGETIKRYVIPMDGYNYQYVYEVGDTKTVNTPKNKGRLDVDATVTH